MVHQRITVETLRDVQTIIAPDLAQASGDDDLAARLARHGYGFKDTPAGRKLVTLPHGLVVMDIARAPDPRRA